MNYCDRCGAAAKARFILPSGNDLLFCSHHAREYNNGLDKDQAVEDATFSEESILIGV